MTSTGAPRRGRWSVPALSAALVSTAVALALASGNPIDAPFAPHWALLVPAYALALHITIDFEFRKDSLSVGLSPLPLAFGAVLLAPGVHLLARVLGTLIDSLLWRREGAFKASFNVAAGALEVGVVAAVVSLLPAGTGPGPLLWGAIFVGLLVGETLSNLAFFVVMALMGVDKRTSQATEALWAGLLTSVVFTALAIIGLSAMWTETSSVAVMALLALGLGFAYRRHGRLSGQQRATERLYEFVKNLGPMHADSEEAVETLEHIRELLQARSLHLAVVDETERWRHITVGDGIALVDPHAGPPGVVQAGRDATVGPHRMSTALVGARGLLGTLTATDRLGAVGDFDMGDARLLETVGAELATALERGRLLAALERAATTDALTGLPNLSETTRLVDAHLASGRRVLVAAIAVDSFREVNDTLGHFVGDELLQEVTRRLRLSAPGAIIGRIGGGRFAVAVDGEEYSGDPELLGLGLRAQVEGSAQLGAVGTHVRLSVGCVSGPEHGTDAENLVRRAETAMYSARHANGGPVLWEPAYEVQGQRRLAVVMALREALASGAIGLGFQPKVSAIDGRVTGVEALARWTHPALGAITADEFIPLAEASGLMGPLTSTVLRQALIACKGWQRRAGNVGVAVNVSAETVLDPSFVTEVAAIITSTGIAPSLLTLELTEGVVVNDPEQAARRMQELRELGIKLSVDDFGTGYSSLTYLKGLPVDEVKIDKGFVNGLVDDPADRAVVRAVVDIAHTLGMRVVAEGVETEDQQRALRVLGVDDLQGYLFARPMPAVDMASWLRKREVAVTS